MQMQDFAPRDVRGAGGGHADRLPGGLLAGRAGPGQRLLSPSRWAGSRPPSWATCPSTSSASCQQRAAAGHPVLHLHGRHPGEVRPGRGHARLHGPAVRPGARRPGLLGHHRGLHPGRHHRHRGRPGDRDGADLAAGDDALRLQHALRHRRAGRLGHHHAAGAAFAGAGGAGRPARQAGGRHVQGRLGPLDPAGADVRGLHLRARRDQAAPCSRRSERSAHPQRLGAVVQVPARHHAVGRADLHRAGLHGRPAAA